MIKINGPHAKPVPWQCCRNLQSMAPGRNGSCFLQQQLVTRLAKHRSSTAAGAGAFGGASGATTGLGSRLPSRSGTWCQTHLEKRFMTHITHLSSYPICSYHPADENTQCCNAAKHPLNQSIMSSLNFIINRPAYAQDFLHTGMCCI